MKVVEDCETPGVAKKRGRKPNHLKASSSEKPVTAPKTKSTSKGGRASKTKDASNTETPPPKESICSSDHSTTILESPPEDTLPQDASVDTVSTVHDKHLILHLNVNDDLESKSDFQIRDDSLYEDDFFQYDPNLKEPLAYDITDDKFSSCPQVFDTKPHKNEQVSRQPKTIKEMFDSHRNKDQQNSTSSNPSESTASVADTVVLPVDASESSGKKETTCVLKDLMVNDKWTTTTTYHCYWDCHPFHTRPYGIPVKLKDGKFHVTGCFCSLECAVAYNFDSNDNLGDSWERYNLINLLSTKMNYKQSVNPAMSKKCLRIFGGDLEIEAFREKSKQGHVVDVLQYPMVQLVEQIDEITNSYDRQNQHYIPLDRSRIEKIEEANKDKSLAKQQSVLEKSMNLKITA